MIKAVVAHTLEVDDVELAVEEILGQLALDQYPYQNKVGLLACSQDYIETGVAQALCATLPFNVLGMNTLASAVNGSFGAMQLSLIVLMSDDIQFAAGISGPLAENCEENVADLYQTLANGRKPAMMITLTSMLKTMGGDRVVGTLEAVSGGVLNFGSLAINYTGATIKDTRVIFNGEAYGERLALLLVFGDVRPRYLIDSVSPHKMIKQKAVVTESAGNFLKAVNDMPASQYLRSIGFAQVDDFELAHAVPIIIDYNDGTPPVARNAFGTAGENGEYVILGGEAPVGSTISIGAIDKEDVIGATGNISDRICIPGQTDVGIIFSCATRNLALRVDADAEMAAFAARLDAKIPYLFAYSGGEIGPVPDKDGYVTRFHNNSLVVCIL